MLLPSNLFVNIYSLVFSLHSYDRVGCLPGLGLSRRPIVYHRNWLPMKELRL